MKLIQSLIFISSTILISVLSAGQQTAGIGAAHIPKDKKNYIKRKVSEGKNSLKNEVTEGKKIVNGKASNIKSKVSKGKKVMNGKASDIKKNVSKTKKAIKRNI